MAKKKKQRGGNNDLKSLEEICEGSVNENNNKTDTIKFRGGEINKSDDNQSIDSKCAPNKEYKDGSCMTPEEIVAIVNSYNLFCDEYKKKGKKILQNGEEVDSKGIVIKKICFKDKNNWTCDWTNTDRKKHKSYLIHELHNRLKKVCDDQLCWIRQEFVKNIKDKKILKSIKKDTFRPKGPRGKFEWLGTSNINDVMTQYEKKIPDFKFLGAVPIDFDDISDMLPINIKNLDYDKLIESGKTKLGIVFNLDPHYKSGSHWVAMYSDLKEGSIEYFDSGKGKPNKRVTRLIDRIKDFIKKRYKKDAKILVNDKQHQKKDSECGVYAINFVLRRANGESFNKITENITDDKTINQCRSVYFRK